VGSKETQEQTFQEVEFVETTEVDAHEESIDTVEEETEYTQDSTEGEKPEEETAKEEPYATKDDEQVIENTTEFQSTETPEETPIESNTEPDEVQIDASTSSASENDDLSNIQSVENTESAAESNDYVYVSDKPENDEEKLDQAQATDDPPKIIDEEFKKENVFTEVDKIDEDKEYI